MTIDTDALIKGILDGTYAVSIHGQGYVGIPLAALLAKRGVRVIGVDIDASKVDRLNRGESPVDEKDPNSLLEQGAERSEHKCVIDGIELFVYGGVVFCPTCLRTYRITDGIPVLTQETVELPELATVDDYLKEALAAGKYRATLDAEGAVRESKVHIISVPTFADSYEPVLAVARAIGGSLDESGHIIINKSTVPVGATDEAEAIVHSLTDHEFGMVHMQERIAEGRALKEFQDIPRTAGTRDPEAGKVAKALFDSLGSPVYLFDDPRITEASKIFENAYRDCNISIANAFAVYCEKKGLSVYQVIAAANTNLKTRIFQPGMVGGHCLPEDTYYVAEPIKDLETKNTIMAGRKLNEWVPGHLVDLLEQGLKKTGKGLAGTTVCMLGLAFKGNTDDTRESGALIIADMLNKRGARVHIHDPWVPEAVVAEHGRPVGVGEALKADALLVATEHTQFFTFPYREAWAKVIVDGRNMVPPDALTGSGKELLRFGDGTA
ncbi:MAG: nucleotide sugar dehydrogenase [Candidatus Undinarchaeales archaeon]|nr:nucleotide sugar dehydrogenase [Candidatus Undinarchaeales archaeon]MDP7492543.1 nucleotide sugar dehydrogenase [Candidatus Undinarchaeales archaeon]